MSATFSEIQTETRDRPAAAVPEFPVSRLTVPEYLSLVDRGFFGTRRVELWEGWVIDRMTHGSLATTIIGLLTEWFSEHRRPGIAQRAQMPVQLERSLPEPDLAIVRGQIRDYFKREPVPAEIVILIEVSDSTLYEDRRIKARMYAQAGVKEYWIVNCEARQIEVYTEPQAVTEPPSYLRQNIYLLGQSVPVQIGEEMLGEIAVSELFG